MICLPPSPDTSTNAPHPRPLDVVASPNSEASADSGVVPSSPLAILLDYAERARGQADATPQQADGGIAGMLVRLGAQRGFVPDGTVSEVIDLPRLTSVPGTVSWYLGLGSLRGRVLPVCDLGGYLFGQCSAVHAVRRVLVHGSETEAVGFAVDDVLGVHTVAGAAELANCEAVPHQGQDVPVLRLADIVTQPRFLRVSLDSA